MQFHIPADPCDPVREEVGVRSEETASSFVAELLLAIPTVMLVNVLGREEPRRPRQGFGANWE